MRAQRESNAATDPWSRHLPWLVALAAAVPFLPSLGNEFVKLDDDFNFLSNTNFRGLGREQLAWMFFKFQLGGVYQPLSWVTHGLDYHLWGLWAGGYHLTSIVVHAACAWVLFRIGSRLFRLALPETGTADIEWAAAFAALLFALHPQRVEVVAWASNRSYVLPALFALWTVDAYLLAHERPERRSVWLAVSLAAFACSLAAKAIAMTLPVVLLVLDVYPLRRWGGTRGWLGKEALAVWREKLPFFALAFVSAVVAANGRYAFGAMIPVSKFGWTPRLAQAAFGLSFYLEKLLVPLGLAPMYTMPFQMHPLDTLCLPRTIASCGLALAAWRWAGRAPGLAVAAAAHALLLFPFLGISQYGLKLQVAADKWFHLAAVGWSLLAGAAVAPRLNAHAWLRPALTALLVGLAGLTAAQTMRWRDSESILGHNVRVDPASYFCHNNLAVLFNDRKEFSRALSHAEESLRLFPDYTLAQINAAVSLSSLGRPNEARVHLERTVELTPADPMVHYNLGFVYGSLGRRAEAIHATLRALQLNPNQAGAHNNLGHYLRLEGRLDEAISHFQEALRLNPGFSQAANNLRDTLQERLKKKPAKPAT
ncbi:MAG: tetratricopeptide repeat protein [Elusimicrobia bacterium]|nr:tetratricopeptide repeat protein [Elusimicrobiota bacterium]